MKTTQTVLSGLLLWGMSVVVASAVPGNGYPPPPLTFSQTIPPGFSLIANPLSQGANTLAALMPVVPNGTVLYKFDNVTKRYSVNRFHRQRWSNPAQTLNPGEGAMIFNPSRRAFEVEFTGYWVFGLSVEIPAGVSLISYPGIIFEPLPDSSPVILPCWAISRRFNPQDDDIVYTFDSARGRFKAHRYHAESGWDNVPVVAATESFFVFTKHPRTIVDLGLWPD